MHLLYKFLIINLLDEQSNLEDDDSVTLIKKHVA